MESRNESIELAKRVMRLDEPSRAIVEQLLDYLLATSKSKPLAKADEEGQQREVQAP